MELTDNPKQIKLKFNENIASNLLDNIQDLIKSISIEGVD